MEKEKLLQVKNLKVHFKTFGGEVQAVRNVTFDLHKGETLAIVGESGSGKSVACKTIMRIMSSNAIIKEGEILFNGKNLAKLPEKEMESIRGKDIAMIFQDPMTSLNPTTTIGKQIAEGIIKHQGLSKDEAMKKAIELIDLVGIPFPEKRAKQYPHQFSGGMRQRIVIAIALACNPKILIADEPTTALDVTIQAQILNLLKDLNKDKDSSIMLITHDLGVVYNTCDRVVVMYGGRIMEIGTVDEIFENPKHPYTIGLLKSIPRGVNTKKERLTSIEGTPPNLLKPPKGCPFYERCNEKMDMCIERPATKLINENHKVDCWKYSGGKNEFNRS
ncbi:ABC transporter ATP-binding protein [Enterococcus faecium]|uniref:ABC transporter ATP-binding protein n=1 Tax=Enterococcus faecium TaxID=1352 RepID=UPI001CC3C2FF|nr:ABC transporter ATP-binding protein [Enterococcus faecium]GJG92746.1 ABC transporter ATP-binding protein [Enterococcus faecium]